MDSNKYIFKDVLHLYNPAKRLLHNPFASSTATLKKFKNVTEEGKMVFTRNVEFFTRNVITREVITLNITPCRPQTSTLRDTRKKNY